MNRGDIKTAIKNYQPEIDNQTLEYYSNYFYVLLSRPEILEGCNINEIIKNTLSYATKIVFYTEQDDVYKDLGPDCKGLRDPETKTIYVRNNLEEPLREITIYHELHHAAQTNPENEEVGINQDLNFGRLIMEAQTQYFAEQVYQETHNITFEEQEKKSQDLRMLPGGVIVSSTHNYEMYDSIISKLCILLGISKDYLVHINFLYKNNEGMDLLREQYENVKNKYNYPYTFEDFMFRIDYIYCTDLLAYKDNPDKETVLKGEETANQYEIHTGKYLPISLERQFKILDDLDRKYFLCLLEASDTYIPFAKYMFSEEARNIANQILEVPSSPEGVTSGHKK